MIAETKQIAVQGRIELADLTANNIGQLRKLNAVLFPVRFGERWYKDVLASDVSDVCKFALFNDIPVANVCCRFERAPATKDAVQVYIMTLGCLAPYRRLGIASMLLRHVLSVAGPDKLVHVPLAKQQQQQSSSKERPVEHSSVPCRVSSVYLHVQTGNEEARGFYEKHGFLLTDTVQEYYQAGVAPRSAWLLECRATATEA